jgi:2,3-diketo-5-methylthio-1-phosphopentane phosphatase
MVIVLAIALAFALEQQMIHAAAPTSRATNRQSSLFVTDFDGTLTRNDFYRIVVERFAPQGLAEHWHGYKSGRLTHFQALQAIFAAVRANEDDMQQAIACTHPEPELGRWVTALRVSGWEVVVASAGCEWYIRRVLAGCRVEDLPVHANPGTFTPEQGLIMRPPPTGSPYFCETTGIDKAAIVQEALDQGRRVAFAGDGFPDLGAARLVSPRFRFARADLITALERHSLTYRPFERWSEVARALVEEPEG